MPFTSVISFVSYQVSSGIAFSWPIAAAVLKSYLPSLDYWSVVFSLSSCLLIHTQHNRASCWKHKWEGLFLSFKSLLCFWVSLKWKAICCLVLVLQCELGTDARSLFSLFHSSLTLLSHSGFLKSCRIPKPCAYSSNTAFAKIFLCWAPSQFSGLSGVDFFHWKVICLFSFSTCYSPFNFFSGVYLCVHRIGWKTCPTLATKYSQQPMPAKQWEPNKYSLNKWIHM